MSFASEEFRFHFILLLNSMNGAFASSAKLAANKYTFKLHFVINIVSNTGLFLTKVFHDSIQNVLAVLVSF